MEGGRRRRPGRLDAAASLAARALPDFCTPLIDQARLDARMLLDRTGGKNPTPIVDNLTPPTPLDEVDPLVLLPRRLADKVRAARRDVAMLGSRLILGKTPAPLIERPRPVPGAVVSRARKTPDMARTIKVVDVVHETADAVSIYLTEKDGSPIEFKPGQFLSVDVTVDGETLRRAYSLASACLPGVPVHITVKRIADGRVSSHLNDTIEPGDTLFVLGPSGNFTIEPRAVNERHFVMLAGGSGITPIMSLLETVLHHEKRSKVTLIYGNRGWDDIIFRERLARLTEELGDRLVIAHVLEQPPQGWSGGTGLLSEDVLAEQLNALGIEDDGMLRYFICGPTPMMDAAHAVLGQRDVAGSRIAEERFTHPEDRHGSVGSGKMELVVISKGGSDHGVQVAPGQTILEAALAAGLDMPFSCAMGGCGSCRVRQRDGEVQMEEPNCLSRSEKEQGYILTCVGRPLAQTRIEVEGS
ncbi:MAG: ferredoxin--NADP reductase [Deltaproteobacteria bacterium]|nr:ferredoxin--NADP reductase [Deltaproteobacteria bacterium]